MNTNELTKPDTLERYSFLWSEARLLIAAVALFIGGTPPVLAYNPVPAFYGLVYTLLKLSWVISGAAALYLLYRWNANHQKLFGGKKQLDLGAFLVMTISGINLGLVPFISTNIGMSISSNYGVFVAVALLYLASAGYLFQRWNESGKKVF